MTLLLGLDPLGVIGAGQEGRVERAALHEFLPFGGGADLLEEIDVVLDLVLGGLGRHEDAAQHQVFDVETFRLAGRNVLPALAVRDRLVIGHWLGRRTRRAAAACRHAIARPPRSDC